MIDWKVETTTIPTYSAEVTERIPSTIAMAVTIRLNLKRGFL